MDHLHHLLAFSRDYCATVCTFLIPLCILSTSQTLWLLYRQHPWVVPAAGGAMLLALTLLGHVLSWIVIGVVMGPTYFLFGLGGTALFLNTWAVWWSRKHSIPNAIS
ncbi:hypothetical protein [Anthocerotibacter panamensis]|uniref:hypothetical protein n=1 Tax=Anthocerotibacter panamensis TaxID=2857077 RepID=UPI001C4072D6|nr:hypothetical protein [Anthocerotibacter panamensis]